MEDMYQLLLAMKLDITSVKNDVSDIKDKLDNVNARMEDIEHRTGALEENLTSEQQRITVLSDKHDDTSLELLRRIEQLEGMVTTHDKLLHPDYDPEKTLVAIRLPDDGSSIIAQTTALLEKGLADHTPIVRATRLPGRNELPGLVKIELPTREDKIRILRNKSNLSGKHPYEDTYLRSSQPHGERLQAANLRVMMDKIPELSNCMLTGNGRIIPAENQPRVFVNKQRYRRNDIQGDDITDRVVS